MMLTKTIMLFLAFIHFISSMKVLANRPNIIFILADDMGWSDFGFNTKSSPIPTPYIDSIAEKGVIIQQYYTHSLCTPSRASLMTGRYHVNAGLNYVLIPGSPAGLRDETITLPEFLKASANYTTSMAGKWHLGSAQHKMTPIGRGFDSFTGIYTWDTDSYTKQIYEEPWKPAMMIDWVKEFANGSSVHFAEPRHSTEAITAAAEEAIIIASENEAPLFLYVPFTAAHSPLQPIERHLRQCSHIPHLWRREFCGMVVGFDEGVRNITETALQYLGNNTIIVITSDNGGSPWFGGLNAPLRGGKTTPFEGGVRVPAVFIDFSSSEGSRSFNGLMHVSDWFPTLASFAGIPASELPADLDGFNLADSLSGVQDLSSPSASVVPRDGVLLEMWAAYDTPFNEQLEAYRLGDFKLINGSVRDPNYYWESTTGRFLNISRPLWSSYGFEILIKGMEAIFGAGPFDTLRILIAHKYVHSLVLEDQIKRGEAIIHLYNLSADPLETNNLALPLLKAGSTKELKDFDELTLEQRSYRIILDSISARLEAIRSNKPPAQNITLQWEMERWKKTAVQGDCSTNPLISAKDCKFLHPWIADDENGWETELISAVELMNSRAAEGLGVLKLLLLVISTAILAFFFQFVFRKK